MRAPNLPFKLKLSFEKKEFDNGKSGYLMSIHNRDWKTHTYQFDVRIGTKSIKLRTKPIKPWQKKTIRVEFKDSAEALSAHLNETLIYSGKDKVTRIDYFGVEEPETNIREAASSVFFGLTYKIPAAVFLIAGANEYRKVVNQHFLGVGPLYIGPPAAALIEASCAAFVSTVTLSLLAFGCKFALTGDEVIYPRNFPKLNLAVNASLGLLTAALVFQPTLARAVKKLKPLITKNIVTQDKDEEISKSAEKTYPDLFTQFLAKTNILELLDQNPTETKEPPSLNSNNIVARASLPRPTYTLSSGDKAHLQRSQFVQKPTAALPRRGLG